MKQLKFNEELVPLIVSGKKTTTWRLFDDKDLQEGDELEFLNKNTLEIFAKAKIISVVEKAISEINDNDKTGHEDVGTGDQLTKHYGTLYNRPIHGETKIIIIKFHLIH